MDDERNDDETRPEKPDRARTDPRAMVAALLARIRAARESSGDEKPGEPRE